MTNPVTGRRTSTGKPVTAWIAMRKDVTGKELTLTSWKTKFAKCRRARTTWTLCTRRTGETIPRTAKFGRIDNSRARSLHWDLRIGKQSPIRYRWTTLAASWSVMKQLSRGEVLCITVAVDQSTVKIGGNDENQPFKIKWYCWIAVRWMEEGTFA